MESKIKEGHRLTISKEMKTVSKSKGKARKELWDSLCAVYENEANKEDAEVDLSELEEWSVTHTETEMRGLAHIVATNPQILSAAASTFTGNDNLILEPNERDTTEENVEQTKQKKNKKNLSETAKKCKWKPSYMKPIKKISPISKTRKNPKLLSSKENLSVSMMKRILEEKSKYVIKPQNTILDEGLSKTYQTKGKRRGSPKSVKSETSKKSRKCSEIVKQNKVQMRTGEEIDPSHKCDLEYRHSLNHKSVSKRPDGRVLVCKLIFKVCHCTESDVVL